MTKAVLFLHGPSQFGFLNNIAREMAEGLREIGCPAFTKHVDDEDARLFINGLASDPGIEMFVMMNGASLGAGEAFWRFLDLTNAPVVGFFVDHPLYHVGRIQAPIARLQVLTTCRHDQAFIKTFIRKDVPIDHLHHGATPVSPAVVKPWADRDIDVLVPSTLPINPEATRAGWPDRYGNVMAALLNAIVEIHDASPEQPLLDAIQYMLGDRAISLDEMISFYKVLDFYLRARIKLSSVRALAEEGVGVTVLSSGWPDDLGERVQRLPAVPVEEGYALMGRSKLVLNHLPPYFESHERPLQAAICGALAASTPSPWVERVMAGNALMLPLSPRESAAAIAATLSDPSLPERADRGRAAVANGQLWRDRGRELLTLAGGSLQASSIA